jgi:hypothetical protein
MLSIAVLCTLIAELDSWEHRTFAMADNSNNEL